MYLWVGACSCYQGPLRLPLDPRGPCFLIRFWATSQLEVLSVPVKDLAAGSPTQGLKSEDLAPLYDLWQAP